MFKKLVLLIFCLHLSNAISSQIDSTSIKNYQKKKFIKSTILPLSLITIGSIISGSALEKNIKTDLRNTVGNNYEFKVDNYLHYAPIAEMYVADALGIKAKNHWFDQTKSLIISDVLTGIVVFSLKNITNKTRPNDAKDAFSLRSYRISLLKCKCTTSRV